MPDFLHIDTNNGFTLTLIDKIHWKTADKSDNEKNICGEKIFQVATRKYISVTSWSDHMRENLAKAEKKLQKLFSDLYLLSKYWTVN